MPSPLGEINNGFGGVHDVDIVDGCLLVLSRWSVKNLSFDEATFSGFHAFDADICMQARSSGRRVVVADIKAFRHTKGGFGNVRNHQASDEAFRRKWNIPQDRLRRRLLGRMNRLANAWSKIK